MCELIATIINIKQKGYVMSITRIITNIPDEKVNFVIAAIKVDKGKINNQFIENGETTIIVEFPQIELTSDFPVDGTPESAWMKIARQELDQKEVPGADSNPRIETYHATTTLGSKTDSVPWCSSFVNFCIEQSGLTGTKSALARSWVSWGKEVPSFTPGCIVVLERGKPPNGHGGFYVGMDGKHVQLLGGNQGNAVSIASFDSARVIAKRIPI
jgi:uncharacterized protein (TIGR02594 family)